MTKLRNYLKIVESKRPLMEANVANPEAIDVFLKVLAKDVTWPEAKAWIMKKGRAQLLNDETVLVAADKMNASSFPEFARQALERGEKVFLFQPTNPAVGSFRTHIAHIIDWFNAMKEVADRKPRTDIEVQDRVLTVKEMSKIIKLNLPQAHAAADKWFDHMGSRLKTGAQKTVEGADIVYEWPDGFYAVSYTSKQAMIEDGQDLQNCLQNAHYWPHVERGEQTVYGVRKPNDEAVIGIRVRGTTLHECKGKNNKPVSTAYVRYAAEFLTAMKIPPSRNSDLESAGITFVDGRYGTFEDVAEVVYNQKGLIIRMTDERFIATKGRVSLSGELDREDGTIHSIDGSGDTKLMREVLSLMNLRPLDGLADVLQSKGLFYSETAEGGKWGDLTTVGEHRGTYGSAELYALTKEDSVFYFALVGGQVGARFVVSTENNMIMSAFVDFTKGRVPTESFKAMLNTMNASSAPSPAAYLLQKLGLFNHGKKHYAVEQDCKTIVYDEETDVEIRQFSESFYFIAGQHKPWNMLSVGGGILGMPFVHSLTREVEYYPEALRRLIKMKNIRKVKGVLTNDFIGAYGYTGTDRKPSLIVTAADLVENLPLIAHSFSPWGVTPEFMAFLSSDTLANISDKEAKIVINAQRPANGKSKIHVVQSATKKVHDVTFTYYQLHFPVAAGIVATKLHCNVTKEGKKDMLDALAEAFKFVKNTPNANFVFGNVSMSTMYEYDKEFRLLDAAMKDAKVQMGEAMDAALSRGKESGAGITSAFAALNAKRLLNKR